MDKVGVMAAYSARGAHISEPSTYRGLQQYSSKILNIYKKVVTKPEFSRKLFKVKLYIMGQK